MNKRHDIYKGRDYDLIVFGASGFTGQYLVEELVRTANKEDIKWAISGRNEQKLKCVLNIAAEKTGIEANNVPIVVSDITDEESLREMTARTQLVINCVGPYTLYGEPVVKACLDTNTHYMDIGGETVFMEEMHLKYDKVAKQRGVYLICCCCLSVDLWLPYVRRQFVGHIHSVDTYTSIPDLNEFKLSPGTLKTLLRKVVSVDKLADVRKRLYDSKEVFTTELPESKFNHKRRTFPSRISHASGLYLPFGRFNESLIRRTILYRWQKSSDRPIHVANYFDVGNWLNIFGLAIFSIIFYLMSLSKCGRDLLEKYPNLFTFGRVHDTDPEDSKLLPMVETYVVNGWGNPRPRHPEEEPGDLDPPSDILVMRLKAPDPGYLSSAICLVQCAYTLLGETHKIPEKGGALTPGVAFGATHVYERLRKRGLSMDVVRKQYSDF